MAPSEKRKKTLSLEKTYKGLTKAYAAVEREVTPTDITTTLIYRDLLRTITARKKSIEKVMQERPEFSAVIPRKMPSKAEDPGRFTIPCKIGGKDFLRCMLDLGSSVNVIPESVARKLEMTDFKEVGISLRMADQSQTFPVGLLEDVPVQVEDDFLLADFVVVSMKQEQADPIILGRPFMATAGIKIDASKGWMQLNLGHRLIEFERTEPLVRAPVKQEFGCNKLAKSGGAADWVNATKPPKPFSSSYVGTLSKKPLAERLRELDSRAGDKSLQEIHKRLLEHLARSESVKVAEVSARNCRPWAVKATVDVPDGRARGAVRKPTGFS